MKTKAVPKKVFSMAKVKELITIGQTMSNVMYNLNQSKSVPTAENWKDWRSRMEQLVTDWDKIRLS